MFKKRLMACVVMAVCGSTAYAGNLYLGPSLFLQDNTTPNSNYRGLHPRMSVGYSDTLEGMSVAGEVFAVPATLTIEDNHSGGAISARSTRSFGATLIPGFMINDAVMGYARLGIVTTEFSSPGKYRAGGQVGVGLQTGLTTYWDLRAEYIFTAYKSVPNLGSVKSDQVGIGLVYKVLG